MCCFEMNRAFIGHELGTITAHMLAESPPKNLYRWIVACAEGKCLSVL